MSSSRIGRLIAGALILSAGLSEQVAGQGSSRRRTTKLHWAIIQVRHTSFIQFRDTPSG